jgi:hypothetical protein
MQAGKILKAVLVDSAEHAYDLIEAIGVISEQKWRHCLDPRKLDHLFLPIMLHKEYTAIMQRRLTKEALL